MKSEPPIDYSELANRRCWVITDGAAGMVAQALGLAEAVGFTIEQKTISLEKPWGWLPAKFWPPGVDGLDCTSKPLLRAPWPDLIISCGRRALGPALATRRRARADGLETRLVVIQHPRMGMKEIDLVVAPRHDGLSGEKVVVTDGAVHRVNSLKLAPYEDHKPKHHPMISVSIGGKNAAFSLLPGDAKKLAVALKESAEALGAFLQVTASRRTDPESEAVMRDVLSGPSVDFWDGQGDNPYFRYLATADAILVTGDSVNMVSEACSTGKPVYLLDLPVRPGGMRAAGKFIAFHESMINGGYLKRFDPQQPNAIDLKWSPPLLDEAKRVADLIHQWYT